CDKTKIQATIGSTLTITCTYKTTQYRFNKKYWCAGDSRSSCEVLMDTDGFTHAAYRTRAQIIDRVSRGLIVYIRDLKLDDSGIYWVAIDKIYADIMTRIQVTVTKGKTLFSSLREERMCSTLGTELDTQTTLSCTNPLISISIVQTSLKTVSFSARPLMMSAARVANLFLCNYFSLQTRTVSISSHQTVSLTCTLIKYFFTLHSGIIDSD
uniref:Immunoglobulin domain-containing protein n=1 Tax=Sinocyclocheilus grahami TaxID=75366 RepID=A0A672SWT5_SINGR